MELRWKTRFIPLIVCFSLFFIVINLIFSISPDFSTPTTCSITWDDSCDSDTLNDAFNSSWNGTHNLGCSGVWSEGLGSGQDVQEVYLNVTAVKVGDAINATCQFYGGQYNPGNRNATEWIFYYNGTEGGWITLANWTDTDESPSVKNKSVVFIPNNTVGVHYIRCSYRQNVAPQNFCANYTGESDYGIRDNDDVNFTVTDYPKYDFWNLTNYTTGAEIASGQTYNRTNSTGHTIYLNVSAHWTNNITHAFLEHNGTGTLTNYTISSITANWTNVTINLSDASVFNRKNITITAIYANNSYDLENKTSPALSFNLNALSSPNITDYWFNHLGTDTNNTNLYTNFTIYANVSDDVGIYAVTANLTYPNSGSIILNLSGNPNPGNRTWNYTFQTETLPLNETGNYTVWWVLINDTGDQVANLTQNLTFFVTNNLTLDVSVSPSSIDADEYPLTLTINISDVNNNTHQHSLNLTITCLNISGINTSFLLTGINDSTTFAHCRAPDSYSNTTHIIVNATDKYSNTNSTTISFTTQSAPSSPTVLGGGDGGGMGRTVNVTNCTVTPKNCTDGIDNDCDGLTDCGDPDCSRHEACKIEIKELNFTLSTNSIEIEQGKDGTILASLFNMGNTKLILNSSIEKECCNISIPKGFVLPYRGELDFSIIVHVPLYQEVGEYTIKTELFTGPLTKTKAFKVIVKKSSYLLSLETLTGRLSELDEAMSNYQTLGVHIGGLDKRIEQARDIIANAMGSIENDDLKLVRASVLDLEKLMNSMNQQLPTLEIQRFVIENRWYLTFTAIMVVISTYMINQVVIPFHRLGLYIKSLSDEEQTLIEARKKAEKQYFMRMIDEKTFRGIMLDKQAKILRSRAALERSKEQRSNLVKERANPKAMARWFKNGFITMGKSIKTGPRKIYNRIRRKQQK